MKIKMTPSHDKFKIKGGHGDKMKVGGEGVEPIFKTKRHYHKSRMNIMKGYMKKGELI